MNCIIANTNDCSREGIRACLQDDACEVVTAAGADALRCALHQSREGILLYYIPFCNADAAMLKSISKKYKRMKIIAFVNNRDVYHLRQCIHEKVAVWMSSHASPPQISAAMQAAANGWPYQCSEMQWLMEHYHIRPRCKSLFRKKELELLYYIGQNYSTGQIATLLNTTEEAIYTIRKRMLRKTGMGSTEAVMWYAIERGHLQCHSNKKATL